MSDEVEIEPEFEDEDEFLDRLKQPPKPQSDDSNEDDEPPKPTGTPSVIQDAQPSPGAPVFTGQTQSREKQRALERANREAKRRQQKLKEDARRNLREQEQDQERQRRAEAREALRASREQVISLRSDAVASRIQTYAMASSLGFPGYVIASAVDAALIRPSEERDIQAQRDYQRQLEIYQESLRKDQIEARRKAQRDIDDIPIEATRIDEQGNPLPFPPQQPYIPQTNTGNQNQNQYPQAPNLPPQPPNQPPNQPPTGGQGMPTGGGPNLPPPVRPTQPTPSGQGIAAYGGAMVAVTAAIQVGQAVNQAVDKLAKNINDIATNAVRGNAVEATKGTVKTAQNIIDPLGIQIPLNVAVQSFDTLLDINKAILDVTRENIAFAPESLQADVMTDIKMLIQQIELTRRNDKTTAELIRANAQFEMAWAEAKSKIIEHIGPMIIFLLERLTEQVKLAGNVMDFGSSAVMAAIQVNAPVLFGLLQSIMKNTEPDPKDLDDADMIKQIDNFFNADAFGNKLKRNKQVPRN